MLLMYKALLKHKRIGAEQLGCCELCATLEADTKRAFDSLLLHFEKGLEVPGYGTEESAR